MVRRLGGKRWQRLHTIVYAIGLLALIHFFQQTKADVWLPTFVAALFGWMIGYRLLLWWRNSRDELPAWMLLGLSVVIAVLTFICEAIGIGIAFNVSPFRVLQMAFDFDFYSIRPGWLVLGAGLIVVAVDVVRARLAPRRPAAASEIAQPIAHAVALPRKRGNAWPHFSSPTAPGRPAGPGRKCIR